MKALPPGTVVKVPEHEGTGVVVNHGRDSGGVWTGVRFDFEEIDGRPSTYQKVHRAAPIPIKLHLVKFGRRFREATAAVAKWKGETPAGLSLETECGLTALGEDEAVMHRDHIEMWADCPDQPRVTCEACLKAEAEGIARINNILKRA